MADLKQSFLSLGALSLENEQGRLVCQGLKQEYFPNLTLWAEIRSKLSRYNKDLYLTQEMLKTDEHFLSKVYAAYNKEFWIPLKMELLLQDKADVLLRSCWGKRLSDMQTVVHRLAGCSKRGQILNDNAKAINSLDFPVFSSVLKTLV